MFLNIKEVGGDVLLAEGLGEKGFILKGDFFVISFISIMAPTSFFQK